MNMNDLPTTTDAQLHIIDTILADVGPAQFLSYVSIVLEQQAERDIYADRKPARDLAKAVSNLSVSDAAVAVGCW